MLYLASQSPRRTELLSRLGIAFRILALDVPEICGENETPENYVQRVARDKALTGLSRLREPDAIVLGADTEVILDGKVFGKPEDDSDAIRMLHALSGNTHIVMTSVCCVRASKIQSVASVTTVDFAPLSGQEIESYVATGEALGKAGAYAIQGYAECFIERLSGSYSGVVGLPLRETRLLLKEFGVL